MYPISPFVRHPLVESQLIKGNSPYSVAELLKWLCGTPTLTTYRVNLLRTTLTEFHSQLQMIVDMKYPDNGPAIYTLAEFPELLCVDPLPAAVAESCQPLPDSGEVIVDPRCGAALLRGAHLYAPGVLAMLSGTKLGDLVNVCVDLAGQCNKGMCKEYNSSSKMFVGLGVVRMQRHQLYSADPEAPTGIAVEMLSTVGGVPSLGDLSGPDALLQNFPSIVCGRVLDVLPGHIVLDMCAAPGNKTTHLAELMEDQGIIVAMDKSVSKVRNMQKKCELNGLYSVRSYTYDATKSYEADGCTRDAQVLEPPFAANTFDRILLDAPCSALGNRPMLASNMSPKMLHSYVHVQRKLFDNAVHLLREHGVLVYSTCTVTEDENERMVAWVLKRYPQLRLLPAEPIYGGNGLENAGLTEEQCCMVQRFGPTEYNHSTVDTVGFFIAKFTKISP